MFSIHFTAFSEQLDLPGPILRVHLGLHQGIKSSPCPTGANSVWEEINNKETCKKIYKSNGTACCGAWQSRADRNEGSPHAWVKFEFVPRRSEKASHADIWRNDA